MLRGRIGDETARLAMARREVKMVVECIMIDRLTGVVEC